jgi:hypothetical protein
MKEEVTTAFMRSSLESNWSTSKPLGLHRIWVTATVAEEHKQLSACQYYNNNNEKQDTKERKTVHMGIYDQS